MAKPSTITNASFVVLVGVVGWVVPGAGHWLLREKKRAVIIFVTISLLFTLGIYIGSVGVIDPVNENLWYVAQMLTSPLIAAFGQISVAGGYKSFGKPSEIGQIYTSIAGMLNLLCITNALYLADYRNRCEKES